MRVGIALSRWVLLVHSVRSVRKVLLRKSERVGSLESQLSQQAKAFLSPWTGCDKKERDVVERKEKKKECERQAEVSKEGQRVGGF